MAEPVPADLDALRADGWVNVVQSADGGGRWVGGPVWDDPAGCAAVADDLNRTDRGAYTYTSCALVPLAELEDARQKVIAAEVEAAALRTALVRHGRLTGRRLRERCPGWNPTRRH